MKLIKPSKSSSNWPRHSVKSVECRKRDLVVRITDWLSDIHEPAYDVEVYIGGVYDWNESKSFTLSSGYNKVTAKCAAIQYANAQIIKLL